MCGPPREHRGPDSALLLCHANLSNIIGNPALVRLTALVSFTPGSHYTTSRSITSHHITSHHITFYHVSSSFRWTHGVPFEFIPRIHLHDIPQPFLLEIARNRHRRVRGVCGSKFSNVGTPHSFSFVHPGLARLTCTRGGNGACCWHRVETSLVISSRPVFQKERGGQGGQRECTGLLAGHAISSTAALGIKSAIVLDGVPGPSFCAQNGRRSHVEQGSPDRSTPRTNEPASRLASKKQTSKKTKQATGTHKAQSNKETKRQRNKETNKQTNKERNKQTSKFVGEATCKRLPSQAPIRAFPRAPSCFRQKPRATPNPKEARY